jgi:ClpP class serine protease
MKRHRYDRQGILAIEPKAFFFLFDEPEEREVEIHGNAAIVSISGPLDHHAGWWCDSYESILERVDTACESEAEYIVLRVDSPGGMVSGCFETARAIRERCESAGKTLIGYAENACSAAYALLSSASRIYAAETAILGSIGVIDTRVDVTKMDQAIGLQFAFITSGARKADGNPHLPMSKEELEERQGIVDAFASMFFGLVEAHRDLSVQTIKGYEARIFTSGDAVSMGLADEVGSFSTILAKLASPDAGSDMSVKIARDALNKAAKGQGAEAELARRALAALDGKSEEEKKDEEAKAEESEDDKKEEAKAEESDEEKDDEAKAEEEEKDDEEKKESKGSKGSSATSSFVERRLAALEKDSIESFLATRPDLTKDQRASVEGLPIERVRAIVNAIPKPTKPNHAAAVAPAATRAAGQDGTGTESRLPEAEKQALDARMGLRATASIGVEKTPHRLTLGAPVAVAGKVG